MLLLPRYPIGLSKASSSAMHKAGKPQSCSVKGDPGEGRHASAHLKQSCQLVPVGFIEFWNIIHHDFHGEPEHEFSGKPQGIAISMSVSQDDQHKEAELGELKSLMSDEYFRVGIPDGHRCGPMGCGTDCLSYHDTASGVSESKTCRWFSVLATWNLLQGHHAANCGRAWLWPPRHGFPGANLALGIFPTGCSSIHWEMRIPTTAPGPSREAPRFSPVTSGPQARCHGKTQFLGSELSEEPSFKACLTTKTY